LKPLRAPHQLLFLLMLRDGPVYGLKLADRIEEASKGHFRVSYGTIYPFLRRTERAGLIRSTNDDSSRRVYYELTPNGKRALKNLLDELDEHREDFEERTLGLLAIYQEIFGRRGLNRLLNRMNELKEDKRC
jgi:DNA-binding PadR family transcriptional regulator